ncbi:MAG: type II toxin-antitoxin system VapC family toxin [Caldimonas sp.]
MVLVDTSVVGNLLLDGPLAAPARALYALDADWRSEPLLFAELTNIIATAARVRGLPSDRAQALLSKAHEILDAGLHSMADRDVLALAMRLRVTGYDARFLCAATVLGVPLVTEDAGLRKKAPAITCALAEALKR